MMKYLLVLLFAWNIFPACAQNTANAYPPAKRI